MKKLFALLLALVMTISLAACVDSENSADPGTQNTTPTEPEETQPVPTEPARGNAIGDLCYGAVLPIMDGSGDTGMTIDPTATGKVTVINFWGTWCVPCKDELPFFEQVAREYSDTVCVIAIHSAQDNRKLTSYIAQNYADSPIIFSVQQPTEADPYNGEYYTLLNGDGYFPYTVILDNTGRITFRHSGGIYYQELCALVENAGAVKNAQ